MCSDVDYYLDVIISFGHLGQTEYSFECYGQPIFPDRALQSMSEPEPLHVVNGSGCGPGVVGEESGARKRSRSGSGESGTGSEAGEEAINKKPRVQVWT